MASLLLTHFFHHRNSSNQIIKNKNENAFRISRTHVTRSSESQLPTDPTVPKSFEIRKDNPMENLKNFRQIISENIGKIKKENMSPKQKGDWKDLVLMSLSFGVYVYISQKLVCAYCAWKSMFNHSW